jgi:alkanesulfonate monooxygenase SsuD/methylene tetrahydromethanopterin reductase-like flavin-dependent oxidoreductase (luciferase family)
VQTDLLLDPFGARWTHVHEAALAAEAAGFDGVWTYDHLAGSVHGTSRVLECWTTLTAIAASVPRIAVGSMVLNVANRNPGTLAVMAATLQEVSGGRLLLGIGAGGGRDTPYASEQEALGRTVGGDRARRAAVERTAATLREVWSGATGGASGFLRPDPQPPIVIGAFGPAMADLAGRVGDGVNLSGASPHFAALVGAARDAHRDARRDEGKDPDGFLVTASGALGPEWLRPDSPLRRRLEELRVDRLVLFARPQDVNAIRRAGDLLRDR